MNNDLRGSFTTQNINFSNFFQILLFCILYNFDLWTSNYWPRYLQYVALKPGKIILKLSTPVLLAEVILFPW